MIFVGKALRDHVCEGRKDGRRWNRILEEGVTYAPIHIFV